MSDIFISYKKEDAGRVVRIVEALRAEGFSVWWDHGIAPGAQWDQTIQRQLDVSKAVVAVWSQNSIGAPWVKEEAGVGKNRGILVPVLLDRVEPPLGFGLIQAANLIGWDGDVKDPRWAFFLGALRSVLKGEKPAGLEAPLRRRGPSPWLWAAGGALGLILAAVVAGVLMLRSLSISGTGPSGSEYEISASRTPPGGAETGPVAVAPETATPSAAGASEQALWDKAIAEKTRAGFQSYLLSYPEGAFANRARDALLTCRTEQRESWKPGPDVANQLVRGVGSVPEDGATPSKACEKAKSDIAKQAKLMCETIVTNGGYRNPKWTVTDRACDCDSPNDAVTVCIADLPYSCRWEMKVPETLEICGG